MQVSEGSDTFEFRSPHGMKAAHSSLRTLAEAESPNKKYPLLKITIAFGSMRQTRGASFLSRWIPSISRVH